MNIGIFIFRRDLRLKDNYALIKLQNVCNVIIPIFILDKNQIKINKNNKYYFSNNVVQFLCESLIDLNNELKNYNSKLRLFYGLPELIIDKLLKSNKINYVAFNSDFSKYSTDRDNKIKSICDKYNVNLITDDNDYTLNDMNKLLRDINNKKPFLQFGVYYKHAKKIGAKDVINNKYTNYYSSKKSIKGEYKGNLQIFYKDNPNLKQHGGRSNALNILKSLSKFKEYDNMHDRLDYETTNISAYLNMGCISVREMYKELSNKLKGVATSSIKT